VTIGNRMRAKRIEVGLTQADLARILHTTANTVARWERNELGMHPATRREVERWMAKTEPPPE